jgi:PAS domain S-box-containing protein
MASFPKSLRGGGSAAISAPTDRAARASTVSGQQSQQRIWRRLLGHALLLGALLTLLVSLAQGFMIYRSRVEAIHRNMDRIVRAQTQSIASSLWQYNFSELEAQAQGVLHYPYVTRVAIRDPDGTVVSVRDAEDSREPIVRETQLTYLRKGVRTPIGWLRIEADAAQVAGDVVGELAVVFVTQALTVAAAALLMLTLLQRSLVRHLVTAANYVRSFSFATSSAPLRLRRPPRHDELDTLVDAFNVMRSNLSAANQQQEAMLHQLRESEQRFRDVLETIRLLALIVDRDGKVTFCNEALLQLTGASKQETLGSDWIGRYVSADQQGQERAAFERGIASGEIVTHHESQVVRRDGQLSTVVWDNTPLRAADGSVSGVASIGFDVTRHRSVEAQLRQAQKMEAVGHLAGGIAHDFNNLVTVTLGTSELLLLQMKEGDPHREMVEKIAAASERAAELTRNLLAFSRKLAMRLEHVNLNGVVTNVSGFLRRIIREDIRLRIATRHDPLPVYVDVGQLEQVLMNLATNARDAMPTGGTLCIETERVVLDAAFLQTHGLTEQGSYALITVSDTGEGMSDQVRQRIFEPFFTTKEVGRGTGLGLPMVYGIVEQHRGLVTVESKPGRGSVFKVYLPESSHTAAVGTQQREDTAPPTGTETVLLVEDDDAVRDYLERVLTGHGYHVLSARDGQEAVDTYRQRADEIQIVLTDMVMPTKSGKAAIEEMERHGRVRVLFMSGYSTELIESRGELTEDVDLITKPVAPMQLLRRIRDALDRPPGRGLAARHARSTPSMPNG